MKLLLSLFCIILTLNLSESRTPPPPPDLADLECAFCVMAISELEGLASENITRAKLEQFLDQEICMRIKTTLKPACELFIGQLDWVLAYLDTAVEPAKTCVDVGLCTVLEKLPEDGRVLPVFDIDLDLPPEQRWVELVNTTDYWNNMWQIYNTILEVLSEEVSYKLFSAAEVALDYLPQPYQGEIKGIADTVGVRRGAMLLLNVFYELQNSCTSIVAEDENGRVYFSRNQDLGYGMGFTHLLRNDTVHLRFLKSNKVAYEAVTFAGYVGLPTGYVPGKFTVSVNARFYNGSRLHYVENLLEEIIKGEANVATQVLRTALDRGYTFSEAKEYFSNTPLITNIYFIIGGVKSGEGAILARNSSGVFYSEEIDRKNGKWYVLQTNYDKDKQPPFYDNRRYYALKAMDTFCESGSNVGLTCLWDVLSFHPVLNLQTLYTAQADTATAKPLQTHQRTCHMEDGSGCPL